MLSYFDNKDFNVYIHWLMVFCIGLAYNCIFEYSKYLGITWVDIRAGNVLIRTNPPLTPSPTIIYIFLFCFALALFFSLRSCFKRIKVAEIYWKTAITDWLKTIFAYFIAFLVFFPIVGHTLKGW